MDEDESKVKIDIDAVMVEPGHWSCDVDARYAVAMDAENGRLVWHRAHYWRTYGRMNGWTRVARIRES